MKKTSVTPNKTIALEPKNSCGSCGNGSYISVYSLPYGSSIRRVTTIRREIRSELKNAA